MVELKKCPFCGSMAVSRRRRPDHIMNGKYFISCSECKAKTGYYNTEEEAIQIWNKRISDISNINYCPHCGEKLCKKNRDAFRHPYFLFSLGIFLTNKQFCSIIII